MPGAPGSVLAPVVSGGLAISLGVRLPCIWLNSAASPRWQVYQGCFETGENPHSTPVLAPSSSQGTAARS